MVPQRVSMNVMMVGAVSVAALSFALVALLIRRFHAAGIVDQVGERSSHAQPTPRGGGLGFVVAATAGWVIAPLVVNGIDVRMLLGVAGAGLAVAAIGFIDDLRGVPAMVRLLVHFLAAGLGLWAVGAIELPPQGGPFSWFVAAAVIVAIAWFVNAFNFMDGTDGFAATHGLAVAGLVVVLLGGGEQQPNAPFVIALGLSAALLGFLPLNWPKARIFMGDVGSGWLGAVVALMLVATCRVEPRAAFAGLAWLSPFVMDPTVCLARRAMRRERVWQAHRSHGFQNLVRRLASHARLLGVWWALMIVIYLPLALLVARFGPWPWLPLALAVGVVQALILKSGVPGVAER